jgi:putative spermidine/putrescine transport system permease protein
MTTAIPPVTSERVAVRHLLRQQLSLKLPRALRHPYLWLLLPATLLLVVFFLFPLFNMIKYSLYTQVLGGTMQPDLTLANFGKFFADDLYAKILLKTLLNALITTLLALILGYPVAFAIARGQPWLSRILIIAVISPLLVGIVIRTYGWTVLLSRQGLINQLLQAIGISEAPIRFMGNDLGIIISLLHVFYPFMVIPLAGALQKIDRNLEAAAMVLGANGRLCVGDAIHLSWKSEHTLLLESDDERGDIVRPAHDPVGASASDGSPQMGQPSYR